MELCFPSWKKKKEKKINPYDTLWVIEVSMLEAEVMH